MGTTTRKYLDDGLTDRPTDDDPLAFDDDLSPPLDEEELLGTLEEEDDNDEAISSFLPFVLFCCCQLKEISKISQIINYFEKKKNGQRQRQ